MFNLSAAKAGLLLQLHMGNIAVQVKGINGIQVIGADPHVQLQQQRTMLLIADTRFKDCIMHGNI